MSLKDEIIHDAILSHARDVEDSLEKLVDQGIDLQKLALVREIEWSEPCVMRLTTTIHPRS